MPRLPFHLHYGSESLLVAGLVDSGASINVLPFDVGSALGLVWAEHNTRVQLASNLGRHEARAIRLTATFYHIDELARPVTLVFAWSSTEEAPLLLGQTNFFTEFDVCYYSSRRYFVVRPAG